ncbi:MAG: FmdB family zinc ribbon protein [Thermodesulfobacteriota bacterium]
MPIYEYECTKCGHHEEVMQKISDPPLAECSECHGAMKKLMSMNSFHLKGSGWYVTDYAGKNRSPAASSSPSEGSEGSAKAKDAGASSKTESKASSAKASKEKG